MTISEKVAYLKGLSEGLNIDTEKSKEGKLIAAIIDVLEEVGLSIEDLEHGQDELAEELDAISDDLSDVEDDLYGDDEDECDCDDDDDFFQVECPNCGEPLDIDEDILDAGVIQCPACKQKFALDLYDGDECGCGCCDDHCDDDDIVAEVEEPAKKQPAKKTAKKTDK